MPPAGWGILGHACTEAFSANLCRRWWIDDEHIDDDNSFRSRFVYKLEPWYRFIGSWCVLSFPPIKIYRVLSTNEIISIQLMYDDGHSRSEHWFCARNIRRFIDRKRWRIFIPDANETEKEKKPNRQNARRRRCDRAFATICSVRLFGVCSYASIVHFHRHLFWIFRKEK